MLLVKSEVARKIRRKLYRFAVGNYVCLNIAEAHRLITYGDGSCSVTRYLRLLRQEGEIDYKDPRSHKNYYHITLLPLFYKRLEADNEKHCK